MSFGQRFKETRLKMGLTQEKFADEFNKRYNYSFTKSTISNYENDIRSPEMNVLIKLAEMMGTSIDYLLENNSKYSNTDVKLDDFQIALFGEIKELSDDAKNKMLDYAKLLKISEEVNNGKK